MNFCKKVIFLILFIILYLFFPRGTKEFLISVSMLSNGPWTPVLRATLEDSRGRICPYDETIFNISPIMGRYALFEVLSFHDKGAALQYFEII